jgi:chromosome segregation ATPase
MGERLQEIKNEVNFINNYKYENDISPKRELTKIIDKLIQTIEQQQDIQLKTRQKATDRTIKLEKQLQEKDAEIELLNDVLKGATVIVNTAKKEIERLKEELDVYKDIADSCRCAEYESQ